VKLAGVLLLFTQSLGFLIFLMSCVLSMSGIFG
jgi:hypothetical protein